MPLLPVLCSKMEDHEEEDEGMNEEEEEVMGGLFVSISKVEAGLTMNSGARKHIVPDSNEKREMEGLNSTTIR